MTLRWLEGFDNVRNNDALGRLYNGSSTSLGALPILGNDPAEDRGGVSDAIYDSCATDDEAILHTPTLVAPVSNTWIVGFAMRSDDASILVTGTTAPYVAFHNSSGEQLRIQVYQDSPASTKPYGLYYGWRIMRGATEIARTDQRFTLVDNTTRAWVYFEFKVTIDNTLGSVEGRFRNIKMANNKGPAHETFTWDNAVSSIDTQDQATAGVDSFVLSFNTGTAARDVGFDNLYVCDSSGTKNNDFLGKCIVTPHHITTTGGGDGDTVDWTLATAISTEDAWQEPATSVEDPDRLTSDTPLQIHLAAMIGIDLIDAADIVGVRMDLYGRMETSGSLDIGFMWRKTTGTPAQVESGAVLSVSSTTVTAASVIAEDDPNTSTDWVYADLNTAQFGAQNKG
jgi:hypothetical protein